MQPSPVGTVGPATSWCAGRSCPPQPHRSKYKTAQGSFPYGSASSDAAGPFPLPWTLSLNQPEALTACIIQESAKLLDTWVDFALTWLRREQAPWTASAGPNGNVLLPIKGGIQEAVFYRTCEKKKKPNYMTLKSPQNRGNAQVLWAFDFWTPTRIQPSSTLWDYLKV